MDPFLAALLLSSAGAAADPQDRVVVLFADGFGAEVARLLTDESPNIHAAETATEALARSRLLSRAADLTDPILVAIRTIDHEVLVIRTRDGTALSRGLEASGWTSPRAVALVVLELIELAQDSDEELSPAAEMFFPFRLHAGATVAVAPGHEPILLQPTLTAGIALRRPDAPWWIGFDVSARIFGRATPLDGAIAVQYQRHDVAVRTALGRRDGAWDTSLLAAAGVSITDTVAEDGGGNPLGDERRVAPWIGAAVEEWLEVGGGFAVCGSAGLDFMLRPARFFVLDRVELEEGGLRVHVTVGGSWESAR